ncbi:MAG: EI24 domain-containing protein, partial [Myxococcota bacterium]
GDRARNAHPTGRVGGFVRGLSYPLEGFAFIREHRLWGLAAVSIAVNVVLFAVVLGLAVTVAIPYVQELNAYLGTWSSEGTLSALVWLVAIVSYVIWALLFVLILGVSSVFVLLVGQAVASPFLDMLSEKVENIVIGTPEQPFTASIVIRSVLLALGDLFWGLVFLAAIQLPIFVLSLTGVGALPASVMSFAFSALLLAVEFVGLALTRRFLSYRERWRVIWDNKWLSLGFGSSAMLLLLIPGLNLILLPLAAVGGTLAYCDLLRAGQIDAELESIAA